LIQAAHEEGYMWNELNLQYLIQMRLVALFLASERFPSGDGEKKYLHNYQI